ncbi:MAG: hypothetical protein H0X33_10080 [Taibaiella sp.]|nr:hypothetical protein [Taibaiella sp.]
MRNLKTFFQDVTHKPPLLFPLVALFHIVLLVYVFYSNITEPYLWVQIIWMLAYTISWIYVCDMRKWAALTYLSLTAINLILYFVLKTQSMRDIYISSMFILDVLFSFFVFFFYKRFE